MLAETGRAEHALSRRLRGSARGTGLGLGGYLPGSYKLIHTHSKFDSAADVGNSTMSTATRRSQALEA